MIERCGQLDRKLLPARAQRISAARNAHQKRITQHLPQSRQRAAHRGLAEAHILRRLADIAPLQQRMQRRQQVEVESGKMHFAHNKNTNYAFLI